MMSCKLSLASASPAALASPLFDAASTARTPFYLKRVHLPSQVHSGLSSGLWSVSQRRLLAQDVDLAGQAQHIGGAVVIIVFVVAGTCGNQLQEAVAGDLEA